MELLLRKHASNILLFFLDSLFHIFCLHVCRFVDRDMFMRYTGLGIGHQTFQHPNQEGESVRDENTNPADWIDIYDYDDIDEAANEDDVIDFNVFRDKNQPGGEDSSSDESSSDESSSDESSNDDNNDEDIYDALGPEDGEGDDLGLEEEFFGYYDP
jgi:hypothetical protein